MRSICVTLLMIHLAKEGSCRTPGRTVHWPALISPEDGRPAMPSDIPQMPGKIPEPPKGLRRDRRFAPWELAELPMLADAERMPKAAPNIPKAMQDGALKHLTGRRRDRRFAPRTQQAVAQIPQVPQKPDGLPQMPGGMPPMPEGQLPEGMPQMPPMPQMPSGRKRRSPKGGKKDGKKKEKEQKPEEKPEEMKEPKEKTR